MENHVGCRKSDAILSIFGCYKLSLKETIKELPWGFAEGKDSLLHKRFKVKINVFVLSVTGELGHRS